MSDDGGKQKKFRGGHVYLHPGRLWFFGAAPGPADRVFWSSPDQRPNTLSRMDVWNKTDLEGGPILDTVYRDGVYTVSAERGGLKG